MSLYTEKCKICGWSTTGESQESLKKTVADHVKNEHESLVEKHNQLLKDVITHLSKQETTKKFTKKEIRELKNRVAEELGEPKEAEPADGDKDE